MKRIAQAILNHQPKRRRRMWKYVSPQRRRLGLLLLALLLTLLYAGWFFTRSSNIRREAKRTLEKLTGADVDVDRATFSVFEGIRLYNVRVRIRGEKEHFFTAEEVVMKHRPGALIFHRRIEPTDIVCLRPVVNLEYENGTSNAARLFKIARSQKRDRSDTPLPLPRIQLKDGLLRTRETQKGIRGSVVEEPLEATLMPRGEKIYEVAVQDPRRGIKKIDWLRAELDVATGELLSVSGSLSDRWLVHMPPEYRNWIDRYQLKGNFKLIEGKGTDQKAGRYELFLDDFSMKLPEAEGNLTLNEVSGTLRFTKQRVEMRDIRGRVEEAGKATFTLHGNYEGYGKNSPFEAKISIKKVRFPEKIRGPLKKITEILQREFRPDGVANISLTFRRDAKGQNVCTGQLEPQDAKMTYRRFPLPVEKVRGRVDFTEAGANHVQLTARRGRARFTVTGTLGREPESRKMLYDVRVSGKDVALDDAMQKALPKQYHKVWGELSPSGRSDVDVHVVKTQPKEKAAVAVDIHMKGFAEMAYAKFPYPLKNIAGEVTLRGKNVKLLWARSRDGRMLVDAKGEVHGLMTEALEMDLAIQATRVPIDKTLLGALQGRMRRLLEELSPSGEIARVSARVKKPAGAPVEYDITTTFKDASFQYVKFPYAVSKAAGEVRITPKQVVIRDVQGLHDQARVTVSGTVDLSNGKTGLAYDLRLQAKDVALDKEFHDAMPPKVREVWKSLTPTGQADIDVTLRSPGDRAPDYRVAIHAWKGSLRYREFPYTFRNVKGKAIVTPGLVVLENMQASDGKTQTEVTGEIRQGKDGSQDVVLRVSAKNLRVDKDLLGAIPPEVMPLATRIAPGGRINAEITRLAIHRPPPPTTQPTTQPAALSATQGEVTWNAEGSVAFRDVVLDMGFGPRKMTGRLTGRAEQKSKRKLGIDARAELTRLGFKTQEVTNLKGRLVKRPDSDTLQINGVSGKIHDGKIDGEMTVHLKDPIHYELSASVWNVNLAKLLNAGQEDPKKWVKIEGMLSGRLSLEATGGENPKRQAAGELILSKGHMFELPVILGLINVVYLQLPGENAFNRGFINYHLKNDLLRIHEIYLTGWDRKAKMGRGISILGTGTLNMKTDKLNLTFLTGPPGELPRLDEITEDILEALSRSLVEVRVTGTLKNPKMDTVPLSPLATIIRRLVEPSLKTE